MGRNTAEKNGFAAPIWVRLPTMQDYQLRKLCRGNRKVGTVARELIMEALAAREAARNKAQGHVFVQQEAALIPGRRKSKLAQNSGSLDTQPRKEVIT